MITIAGAGPVGGYVGYLLAKRGHDVRILEEHPKVGEPFQCTGLLTTSIAKDFDIKNKDFLLNITSEIEVNAPDKTVVKIPQKEYIVDRTRFDRHLINKAVDNGAELLLNHRLMSLKHEGKIITLDAKDKRNDKIKKIKTDILIGADGPYSIVSRYLNPDLRREYFHGIQARIKLKTDARVYKTYFGGVCPGFFAWVVPESGRIVRAGIALRKGNVYSHFRRFLDTRIKKYRIIDKQAGMIPIYNPRLRTEMKRETRNCRCSIYTIGDAAAQVKATTGGGIVPGARCAKHLTSAIKTGHSYEKLWKHDVGKELWLHLKIRNVLDRFSDRDYNRLVRLMDGEKVKNLLSTHTREHPSRLIPKLILAEPRLLLFMKHLF